MIIYNLTDRTPPWENNTRTACPVKLFGRVIPSGGHLEFSNFPLRAVSGLINSHTISVDCLPGWYQTAGDIIRQAEDKKLAPPTSKTEVWPKEKPREWIVEERLELEERPKKRSKRER